MKDVQITSAIRHSAMKRILFVTKNMEFGGAQKKIVDLANGLYEKGFEIAILVFDRRDEKRVRIKDLTPEIQVIAPPPYPNHPVISLCRGIYETVKAVREWKPEIVYSNLWNTNPFVVVAGRFFGVRIILEVSNSERHELEGKKHKAFVKFYRKSVFRLAHAVIAVSEGVEREVRHIYKVTHVQTVYNCIDIENVIERSRAQEDVPHEYLRGNLPVLVAVGRMHRQKGYAHLLEAFKIVNETTEARLIIVGDGDLKEELHRTAGLLGIDAKIAMVGETEPYTYMRHGDIFVLSSLYEGFGIVLIEAMSLGIPVISTDCDHGPREIIENGKNGLLVPVADPPKMASEIIRLIRDEKLRHTLGQEAQRRSQDFARDRMVSDYEEIMKNL